MEYRSLGKTGLKVSIVGFGGIPIMDVEEKRAIEVVDRAVDLGINHIHTAPTYGDSAAKIGKALKGRREECVLNVKISGLTREKSETHLRKALEMLQTDHIEIAQFRITKAGFERGMGQDGGLQVLREAQDEGIVDCIGITDHHPEFLAKAIRSGEFSNLVVPFNFVYDGARERLLPAARKMKIGVVAMKPLGKGVLTNVSEALNYIWGEEVPSTIVGMGTVEEVEEDARIGEEVRPLSRGQLENLESMALDLKRRYRVENGALLDRGLEG